MYMYIYDDISHDISSYLHIVVNHDKYVNIYEDLSQAVAFFEHTFYHISTIFCSKLQETPVLVKAVVSNIDFPNAEVDSKIF